MLKVTECALMLEFVLLTKLEDLVLSLYSEIFKFDPVSAFVIQCCGSLLFSSARFLMSSLLDLVENSQA